VYVSGMLQRLALISLLLLGGLTTPTMIQAAEPAPNTLSRAEKKAGWRLLFDGKTTEGWRRYKKEDVQGWEAVDGALVRTGKGGDLMTKDEFESFELSLEWQIAEGGNSGVMYHAALGEKNAYESGPEMQVLDNLKHHDGKNPLTSAGACYGLYPPAKDVTKPAGQWNHARLIVNHNKVEHWLNGEKVVAYEKGGPDWNTRITTSKFKNWANFGKASRGYILLQDHGDKVAYRNVKLRVLGKP
jgi:hypothetical protein